MADRHKGLTEQIVVRVDPELQRALKQDAEEHGRTVAQTIRFLLNKQVAART